MSDDKRFAVLIDSDNVSRKYIKSILEEVSNFGVATYKRIYGDWTRANGWKDELLENSIIPIQQYSYTTGKNATDSAMIIDAMDILYSGNVDGFCLVSSDSDFTRLAARLREAGMYVIGMGEDKTPNAFRKACNIFRILEVISGERDEVKENAKGRGDITSVAEIEDSICKIIMENSNQGKETQIGEIGSKLNLLYPDFDVRNYGYSKLTTFISDSCKSVELLTARHQIVLRLKEQIDEIKAFIVNFLKNSGGEVDNMSRLNVELSRQYPNFNIKNYGYNKFSSFVKSLPEVEIVNSTGLRLRDNAPRGTGREARQGRAQSEAKAEEKSDSALAEISEESSKATALRVREIKENWLKVNVGKKK